MAKEKKILDRGMIEEFAERVSNENARKVFYTLSEYLDDVAINISQVNSLVNVQNIDFLQVGDVLTDTLIQMSELNFFLAVRSAQIELNSIAPMENRFKNAWNKLVYAWKNRNRKTSVRAQKKQQKKLQKKGAVLTEKQLLEKKDKPYNLINLKNDFFEGLTEHLTNLTVLYNSQSLIRILARDEFGFRINIYPVFKHDDYFKIWNSGKGKFVETRPLEAKELLEKKTEEILKLKNSVIKDEDILYKIIRIFKNLFYNLKQSYNYQFVESLIYACPNSLFRIEAEEHYIYDVFLKVLNYINNMHIGQIPSIYNQDKTIFQQENSSVLVIKSFIKDIKDYLG